jgi:hypothetical protein
MKNITLILPLLLYANVASAQQVCDLKETVSNCLSRLSDSPEAKAQRALAAKATTDAQAEVTDETWERLIRKATGLNTPDLGLESATEDFLPLLRIAFAGAGLLDGVGRSAFNFERNLGAFGSDDSWQAKLKGSANEATVFGPLKEAFDEEVRAQRVEAFQQQFGDLDDYSLTLDVNRSSERFGRSPNPYSQEVFRHLLLQVGQDTTIKDQSAIDLLALLDQLGIDDQATFEQLQRLPPGTIQTVEQAVVAAAQEHVTTVDSLKKKADEYSIFQVADLLNNQPQLNGSGGYRWREGAAGPDEFSVKIAWEVGFVNLNTLEEKCGRPSAPKGGVDFTTCYTGFLKGQGVKRSMEHGDRFSVSAEYNEIKPFRFSMPTDQINLDLDSRDMLVVTLAYARYLDISIFGDNSSRIDLTGRYESENDRGVVGLTYTNRFLDSVGGSIGVSYANHERFLPESDKVLSAHFGLSFKTFSKEAPTKP